MKLTSSLILTVGALFVLGCATVGSNPVPLISDYQTMAGQTFISGTQYYLEDIYDYDVFFIIQPVIKQALLSGTQYYLKDIYDYDDAFLVSHYAIKQTDDSKNLLDYFAVLSVVDETPFAEPVPEHTLVSGIRYRLEDIYDYDDAFFVNQPVVKEIVVSSIIVNETPFPLTEPVPEQTLVSGTQYYLEDIYDYDEPYFATKTPGRN